MGPRPAAACSCPLHHVLLCKLFDMRPRKKSTLGSIVVVVAISHTLTCGTVMSLVRAAARAPRVLSPHTHTPHTYRGAPAGVLGPTPTPSC